MSKINENILVPKLRFPDFINTKSWKETTLTQVADYENGKAHEQDIAVDGEFIVVNSKFISQDGEVKKFTNTAFCPATKGDVLMVLSDIPNGKAIAKCFLVEEDNRYSVNQRICRITPRNLNSKILYYLLNRNPYFLEFDDGVKQTNLRKEDVLNCPLLIPSDPKEQQKIASCLSSLDEIITTESQKLEMLKDHKKGLLQNLLPQEGETTPKFRFKEFHNSGDWVAKELGSCCNSLSSGKDKNVEDGEYELYGSTGIIGRAENASYEGDFILVARVGANAGLLNKVKGKFGVTDNTLVIDLVKKDIINFIFYSLENVGLKELVFGSGQPLITSGQLKSFLLSIPASEQEQKKISSTLLSVDELISAQNQKVETLKLHKKGLLQGLFPTIRNEE